MRKEVFICDGCHKEATSTDSQSWITVRSMYIGKADNGNGVILDEIEVCSADCLARFIKDQEDFKAQEDYKDPGA